MNKNNYYDLELFLDPAETDPAKLTELLKKKIKGWNRDIGKDTKFVSFVEKAKRWLDDLGSQGPLRPLADAARKERLNDLRHDIAEVERDGILEQHEWDYLLKTFGGSEKYFTEQTIKGETHFPITKTKVAQNFPAPKEPQYPPGVKIPDRLVMDAIEKDLKIINDYLGDNENYYKDLFDLVGLAKSTDADALKYQASEKSENNRKITKKTPRVEAEGRLCGEMLKFFATEDAKKGYILALKRRPLDRLIDKKFSKRALGNTISYDDYNLSIEQTMELGFNQEEAQWYVYDYYCNKRKCPPPAGPNLKVSKVQCRNCYHLNDPNAERCSSCGIPLKMECPRCGFKVETQNHACAKCGFAIGNIPNALIQIEKMRKALASNNVAEAEDAWNQSETWWPGNPDAKELGKILLKKKEEKRQLNSRKIELESQIRLAVEGRAIYRARKLIDNLREIDPNSPILSGELQRVNIALTDVATKLKSLPTITDTNKKVAFCEDILAIASDCAEAKAIMDRVPPSPPTGLSAKATPNGVQLQWSPSPSNLKSGYIVVRKQNAAPASEKDGEIVISELNATTFLDTTCTTGIIYGYSVFTQRGTITESSGCQSSLTQIIVDLSNAKIEPGSGAIILLWKMPTAATGVVISRWKESPGNGKATQMRVLQKESYVDGGLENGVQYAYKIQTIYRGPDGNEIVSNGVVLTGIPKIPPDSVNDLQSKVTDDQDVMLEWTPPKRGEVYIFCLTQPPDAYSGKRNSASPESIKERLGVPIPIHDSVNGKTLWKNNNTGILYFLPASYDDGVFVFGRYETVTMINDVQNMNIQFVNSDIYLTWKWPKGVNEVIILRRQDCYPSGPNDTNGKRVVFSLKEYELQQAYRCPTGSKNYYFALYSYISRGEHFSKGVKFFAGKTGFRYDIRIKGSNRKNASACLDIQRESGGGDMPEFIVKSNADKPPLNRNFGDTIMTIPATSQKKITVNLPEIRFNENMFIKLFIANQTEEIFYNLNAPPTEKLKLEIVAKGFLRLWLRWIASLFKKRNRV